MRALSCGRSGRSCGPAAERRRPPAAAAAATATTRRRAIAAAPATPATSSSSCRAPRHHRLVSRPVVAAAAATSTNGASTQQRPSPPPPPPGLRGLYPPSPGPHASGHLRVGDEHSIYYEVHGDPAAPRVALFLHGGPGAGCFPNHARFFDPASYRAVLVDQRGCGRSTPTACLRGNTTAELVGDLEALRRHLGVRRWHVVLGGSWGVALALAYAQAHPSALRALVLRGVCLMRRREIDWMYRGGAGALRPLSWRRFLRHLPPEERGDPLLAYYRRLLSPEGGVRAAASREWLRWEMAVGFSGALQELLVRRGGAGDEVEALPAPAAAARPPTPEELPPPPLAAPAAAVTTAAAAGRGAQQQQRRGSSQLQQQRQGESVDALLARGLSYPGFASGGDGSAQALLEAHYSMHGAFLCDEHGAGNGASSSSSSSSAVGGGRGAPPSHDVRLLPPLLARASALRHIPTIAVQGAADLVTPPLTAVELAAAWPELELRLVPGAGHSMYDPAVTHELVCATDRMRQVPFDDDDDGGGSASGNFEAVERHAAAAVVAAANAAAAQIRAPHDGLSQ